MSAQRVPMLAAETDAGLAEVTYVTIPEVEIARVGMKWPAATGPVTLTFEHLADAVMAANDDPFVLPPRLKLGHTDARFNEDDTVWDPFAYHGELREDGSPAYGKVTNLRLVNDGAVMVGDYVEVPNWLANAAPSAYPSRSQEATWDVVTPGGKRYSMVVTAVAMLGDRLPAIATLADLIRLLTTGFDPAAAERQPVTARRNTMPVAAAADVDAVVHQCWTEFCVGERLWWWPCSVWVDPNQIICDDDEGHLYRVPFTTDADGIASFGDPVAVVQQFRDLPASSKEPAVAASRPVATFASAAAAGRPKDRVRPVAATVNEGASMNDEQKKLAATLGLGEDATVEQLNEKLQADALANLEAANSADPPKPDEPAEAAADAKPDVQLPVAASVDPDALKRLQEDARLGREAREQQIRMEREQLVDERIRGGFIVPASRDAHLAELGKGGQIETAHRAYLASLTAAIVPVDERGKAPSETAASTEVGWFAGREIKRPKETN